MKGRARTLRKNQTDAEKLLWRHLRNRQANGWKFRRQHVIGQYIVDFACLERKLIIELDGGQHAGQVGYDKARTAFLESKGFRVMRFWNNTVLAETNAVLEAIYAALTELGLSQAPYPGPPPHKGVPRSRREREQASGGWDSGG